MTYKQMLEKRDKNDFLYRLNILKVEKTIIELNIDPDFEATEYKKYVAKDYVFFHKERFINKYDSVVKCKLHDFGFYSDDEDLNEMINHGEDTYTKEIGDADTLSKINMLKVLSIDNIEKSIDFFGAFYGDNYTIDLSSISEVKPVAKCFLLYIPYNIKNKPFYYQLLAESRLLIEEGKIKLAFFTAFSAMDLYINYWEAYHKLELRDENGGIIHQRLEDRLKAIYKNAIGDNDISKNVIWGSLMPEFKNLTEKRNAIGHGREITITEEDYKSLLAVISSFIITMEKICGTFDDIEMGII